MRNIIQIIATVCMLATICCNAYAQTAHTDSAKTKMNIREEAFGRQVFKAFQTNDEALYAALQPTNEEYKALLQRWLTAKVNGLTQGKIDEMIARRKREAEARFREDFVKLQAQATEAGIVWEQAVYENYDSQDIYPKEIHQKYLVGTIWFTIDGVRYLMEDVQAVDIPEGYRLQRLQRIRKAEEVN